MTKRPEKVADQDLVKVLAREVVHRVAPGELRTFRFTSEAYFADPRRALKGDRASDGVVGSGVTEVVEALTPVVLAVSSEVALYLAGLYAVRGASRAGRAASEAVRRLIRARSDDDAPGAQGPILELRTAEERHEVRRIVEEVMARNGYAEELAREIADALTEAGPEAGSEDP
ncbi:hypothetical protein [Streptomyces sp. WAC04114]|uniref:hypothetical protein n=1 Tax=Streptomyces sp. WAC04114 TaxID=2867961 RepID=UPI001C8CA9A4|nr:hypothetical protein [Streptomyces sp. WAC04114]MBX9362362.1 hypothetical protein [Streptomyces sp. WAC04114]